MKIRVVIFNGINQFADVDLGLQFLADFPAMRMQATGPWNGPSTSSSDDATRKKPVHQKPNSP